LDLSATIAGLDADECIAIIEIQVKHATGGVGSARLYNYDDSEQKLNVVHQVSNLSAYNCGPVEINDGYIKWRSVNVNPGNWTSFTIRCTGYFKVEDQ
jgi:hypothetical protein